MLTYSSLILIGQHLRRLGPLHHIDLSPISNIAHEAVDITTFNIIFRIHNTVVGLSRNSSSFRENTSIFSNG